MDENQTNQNLNQQPVQPVQPQLEQVQQSVQGQPVQPVTEQQQVQQQPVQGQAQSAEQPSVSMQIQQLLVQQQQYQKQYNDLVDYVKKTPNLPIEQVNQIKAQLDQLNALFVQGKQQLQALGYNQVQITKPVEIKKGARTNFSFKKIAIGCGIILLLIFAGFFITLSSLIKTPTALLGIGITAANAKVLLQVFTGLLFGSVIILMLGVIVSNIYRLITVKNHSKWQYIRGLLGGFIGVGIMGVGMGFVFGWIGKIKIEVKQETYDIIQPYIVGRVENEGYDEFNYPYKNDNITSNLRRSKEYVLIAPSEMAFAIRWNELIKKTNKDLPSGYQIVSVTFSCGDDKNTILEQVINEKSNEKMLNQDGFEIFGGTCLYSKKGKYTYSLDVTYDTLSKERRTKTYKLQTLEFASEVKIINEKGEQLFGSKYGEFLLGKAPAKISVQTTQVFRAFGIGENGYYTEWDMDGDFNSDRADQQDFYYTYKIPKVYYVTYKFPEISDEIWYRFPVRVEQSDKPICDVELKRFDLTPKYQITTTFVDESSASISSYKYKIKDLNNNGKITTLDENTKTIVHTFPEKGKYVVIAEYITVDGKKGQCESDTIQLQKQTFDVWYAILAKDSSGKFKELCNSKDSKNSKCTQISLNTIPQEYQLQIKSITPSSVNTQKVVYFESEENSHENKNSIMEDNGTYDFKIPDEGVYELRIVTSDSSSGMEEEEKIIKFTAKKLDVVGIFTVSSNEKNPEDRVPVSEGFEPLTVILDASKTEINNYLNNGKKDEIIYFSWDFGDGEKQPNQSNGIIVHTYNYDYDRENGVFTPKVKIRTLGGIEQTIEGPRLSIKKQLISVELSSISHPTSQAPVDKEVTFMAEFDGLPEKMIWDFGDGTDPYTCKRRDCTEVQHTYSEAGDYLIKLSLEFDAVQQIDQNMKFRVYNN